MPFTYPDDMSLHEYLMYEPARPHQGRDPIGQGGQPAPAGLDTEDDVLALCPINNNVYATV